MHHRAKNGFLGTSGIVGAGAYPARGRAPRGPRRFSKEGEVVSRLLRRRREASSGAFHETLNIASLWKLPVIFVMENNGYNVVTTTRAGRCQRRRGLPALGEGRLL